MILRKYVYKIRSIALNKDGAKRIRWCNNIQLNNGELLIRDVVEQTSKC